MFSTFESLLCIASILTVHNLLAAGVVRTRPADSRSVSKRIYAVNTASPYWLQRFQRQLQTKTGVLLTQKSASLISSSERQSTSGGKVTGESCRQATECKGSRMCYYVSNGSLVQCVSSASRCICNHPTLDQRRCTDSTTCDVGERCVRLNQSTAVCWWCQSPLETGETLVDGGNCGGSSGGSNSGGNGSGSTGTSPASTGGSNSSGNGSGSTGASPGSTGGSKPTLAPPGTTSPPCVGVEALAHLDRSALVFATHRTADVLCDEQGSCATAGHFVMWRGRPMMMRSYCNRHANCTAARRAVNSPRLSGRGVRVPARTDGLEFTALSARHHSTVEQVVMAALVWLGW